MRGFFQGYCQLTGSWIQAAPGLCVWYDNSRTINSGSAGRVGKHGAIHAKRQSEAQLIAAIRANRRTHPRAAERDGSKLASLPAQEELRESPPLSGRPGRRE